MNIALQKSWLCYANMKEMTGNLVPWTLVAPYEGWRKDCCIYVLSSCYAVWIFNGKKTRKLENCVCKTQVTPPCPKQVLTPCHILTHDPQHIQSILETNIWNVKVKIAVILSKIMFLCAKKQMHIFNMLLIAVQSFKINAWKELITQSYYLLMKPNLKIV